MFGCSPKSGNLSSTEIKKSHTISGANLKSSKTKPSISVQDLPQKSSWCELWPLQRGPLELKKQLAHSPGGPNGPQGVLPTLSRSVLGRACFETLTKTWFFKIVKIPHKYVCFVNMHSPWGRRSGFPDPPLEHPSAVPCPLGSPRALPKPTLDLPGSTQDAPKSP